MVKTDWNAPYFDRKVWLLENLEKLHVEAKEALVLLLIDHFNSLNIPIHHELLAKKLKITEEDVEEIFTQLAEKGYLNIDFLDGHLVFDICGVYEQESIAETKVDRSLIEDFEMEFGRMLSPVEMDRILNLASTYHERRVRVALNEAASCDVRNLNYIEKILMTWMEKGYSIEDVENGSR